MRDTGKGVALPVCSRSAGQTRPMPPVSVPPVGAFSCSRLPAAHRSALFHVAAHLLPTGRRFFRDSPGYYPTISAFSFQALAHMHGPDDPAQSYRRLVRLLRSGQRAPLGEIDRILTAAERTDRDLIRDTLAGPVAPSAQPGDPCPITTCPGRLIIYNSKRRGSVQVQYLRCNHCRSVPPDGKRVVSAVCVRRRSERTKSQASTDRRRPEH